MSRTVLLIGVLIAGTGMTVFAGDYLKPPGPPGSEASRMRTLNEIEPATPIHSLPFVITNSGKYVVVEDLHGTNGQDGIVVQADNVTIDLNGFTLVGGTGSGDAIDITGKRQSIAVLNGVVRDWGRYGVYAIDAFYLSVVGITSISNGWGGTGSCPGIGLGKNSEVRDCISNGSKMAGISVKDSSVVRNCKTGGNGHRGIDAQNGSSVIGCSSYDNASDGIAAYHGTTVTRCTAYDNAFRGIFLLDGCTVTDCTAYGNTNVGFYVGAGVTITGCSASRNGAHGIYGGGGCIISDCTAYKNAGSGIRVTYDAYVKGNTASSNDGAGIEVAGYRNRIEHNHAASNDIGIDVNYGQNIIVRNTTANSTTREYDIASGNLMGVTRTSLTGADTWDNFDLD